tara:strand:+ start:39 stop:1265 length:1227 start_codon:yes stop_codon:yes gene_type:complete
MSDQIENTLFAIYDLEISPCSFDFFQYLLSAELHRKRYGFDNINLIFIPGSNNGFRKDNIRSDDQNKQFYLNVLIPGAYLIKSVKNVQSLANRNDIFKLNLNINNTFPRGYEINKPITDYILRSVVMARLRTEDPIFFEAPEYALSDVRKFLNNIKTRKKILTLTVRELEREDNGTRSINYKAWNKALKELTNTFLPIVIRDSNKSFETETLFEGIKEYSIFSNHIHYRQALYELSDINFFKNNGPVILGLYGRTKAINFNQVDENIVALSSNWMKEFFGMDKGQLPLTTKNKNNFYGEESYKNIIDFALNDDYEKEKEFLVHDFSNNNEIALSSAIGISGTVDHLKKSIFMEDLHLLKVISFYEKNKVIKMPNLREFLVSLEGKTIPANTVKNIETMAQNIQTTVFH